MKFKINYAYFNLSAANLRRKTRKRQINLDLGRFIERS